jgi:hypothetical protein
LPAVDENATNNRRRDEVYLVMAVNGGGIPAILAQKQCTLRFAFTPENLLDKAGKLKSTTGPCILDIRFLDPGEIARNLPAFDTGEAEGKCDALQSIAIAAGRLRSRLLP